MDKYMAVFKIDGATAPNKAFYSAEDVAEAINKMIQTAGVSTTSGLVSFEILKVMGNNEYGRVAIKNELENKMRVKLPTPQEVVEAVELSYSGPLIESI